MDLIELAVDGRLTFQVLAVQPTPGVSLRW